MTDVVRQILDAAALPLVLTALEGSAVVYANPAALTLFRARSEEAVGHPGTSWWVHAEDRERFLKRMAAEQHVLDFEVALRRRDTSEFWGSVSANLAQFEGRDVVFAAITDISDRRQAQERLRESENRLRLILDNMQDVVWTLDARTRTMTFVTPSIERLRGLTVEEALTEPIEAALTPESFARAMTSIAASVQDRSEAARTDIYEQPCRDGSIKHVEIATQILRDEAGNAVQVLGVSRDATRRVEAEAARERLLKELHDAVAEVRRLEGMIPICSYCKKVRDDRGFWNGVEAYVTEHSGAMFSHGICPTCLAEHFPDEGEVGPMVGDETRRQFVQDLCIGDRAACERTVASLLAADVPVRSIYRHLFRAAMYEVGQRWEEGRITVATEHLATSITESLMAVVAQHAVRPTGIGRRAIIACAADEFHQLGARMVADVLELRGWQVDFLGAGSSADRLVAAASANPPDFVGISITTEAFMRNGVEAVERLRAGGLRAPIVLGGQGSAGIPRGWRAGQTDVQVIPSLEELELALPAWE